MKKRSLVKSYSTTIFLRIILGLAAFALLFLIFIVYHEGGWHNILDFYRYFFDPKKLRSFIMSFGPFSVIVFVVVQALQVIVAPIPGELTGFVGGFLYGNFLGSVLSTVGLTIGSTIAFGLSRRYGLRYVEKIVKKRYIDKFNFFVTHKGLHIAFILFLIPGATLSLQTVWSFANIMNGLMAFPNLIALFGLSSIVVSETRSFSRLLKREQVTT